MIIFILQERRKEQIKVERKACFFFLSGTVIVKVKQLFLPQQPCPTLLTEVDKFRRNDA